MTKEQLQSIMKNLARLEIRLNVAHQRALFNHRDMRSSELLSEAKDALRDLCDELGEVVS